MAVTLTTAIDRITNRLISDSLRQDPDIWRHAKRIAVLNLAFAVWVVMYAAICTALGAWQCGLLTLWTLLPLLSSGLALQRGASPAWCGNVSCLGGWTMITAMAVLSGGGVATPLIWYTVLPVLATLASGVGWGLAWTLACIASIGGFALANSLGISFPQQFDPPAFAVFGYTLVIGLVVCHFIMTVVRVGVEQRALAALHEARRRLADVRRDLKTLQAVYGFSMDDWARLRREKAALERFVRLRYGELDLDDPWFSRDGANEATGETQGWDELADLEDRRSEPGVAAPGAARAGG